MFLLFLCYSCYSWKVREWFALSFALVIVPILAHTCCIRTFSCVPRERTVLKTIVLILIVFIPYALLSQCYLVTFFFIRIIREKFELTLHADSCSFANINRTLSSWLHTCLIQCYLNIIEKELSPNKIFLIHAPLNRNEREFQTFYIRPHLGTYSAQWDWGINDQFQ